VPVEGRKSEVQKSPTGGVKLPFDWPHLRPKLQNI
jgi:hypothetical protein